jgi:hypothetical protein
MVIKILMFLIVFNLNANEEVEVPGSSKAITIDPFSGFSNDIEEEKEEEELERFYSYGRMLQFDAYVNFLYLFGGLPEIYQNGWIAGLRLSYFLDWNLAILVHLGFGKMGVNIENIEPTSLALGFTEFTGHAFLFSGGASIKYYPNFYDISRYIAFINPAINVGLEFLMINDRITTFPIGGTYTYHDPSHRVFAPSLFFGASFEFPIFRKTYYLGVEGAFHYTFLPSINKRIPVGDAYFDGLNYSGNFITFGGYVKWNI